MADKLTPQAARRRARDEGWLDQIKSENDERAACQGYYFDRAAADRPILFCRQFLRHTKGELAGQPFDPLDWQREDVLGPLFGWKRPNGTRRFRVAYIEIPKKNGKSTLAAAIANFMLIGDGEQRARVFLAATDRKQAGIVWEEAAAFCAAQPDLAAVTRPYKSTKTITFEATGSSLVALSRETFTSEGLDASATVIDELHAHKSRLMWDVLRYAGSARRQPLLVAITTAGWDRNSICWEQHQYAERVADGQYHDLAFFPYIRAAGTDDDWKAEATWFKANPSLGHTIALEDFRQDFIEAENTPSKTNTFKRYRLNIWTQSETVWIKREQWDACGGQPEDHAGHECWAGLDLASTRDTAALTRVFRLEDGTIDVLWDVWIPEEGMRERETRDFVPYSQWHAEGAIYATEGSIIDYDCILAHIMAVHEVTPFRSIACDPHNAVHTITTLMKEGINITPFTQTIVNFTGPCKYLERLLSEGGIRHGGHPVANWQAGNVQVRVNENEDIRPVKAERQDARKIDMIVALLMALGRLMLDEDAGDIEESPFTVL
jgi:phage terminase large subunit-like protein